MSDELWPTSTPDFEKQMRDIEPRTARRFKELYMGEPPTVDMQSYKIAKEFLRYEEHMEALHCPLNTPHGPMPATSAQRSEYIRKLNSKRRFMCEKYGISRHKLTEIIRQHRDIYEKFREHRSNRG